MKNCLGILTILLFSVSSFGSELIGDWIGKGTATHIGGVANCGKIETKLTSASVDSLTINKIFWKCGGTSYRLKDIDLKIVNGNVYYENKSEAVGTMTDTVLDLEVSERGRFFEVRFESLGNNSFSFYKKVTSEKNGESIEVKGLLSPKK